MRKTRGLRISLGASCQFAVGKRAMSGFPITRSVQGVRIRGFDDPNYLFELKYDGFRALPVIQNGRAQLLSRNGNAFASFSDPQHCCGFTEYNTDRARWRGPASICCDMPGRAPGGRHFAGGI
jgi:hypothetical protein